VVSLQTDHLQKATRMAQIPHNFSHNIIYDSGVTGRDGLYFRIREGAALKILG